MLDILLGIPMAIAVEDMMTSMLHSRVLNMDTVAKCLTSHMEEGQKSGKWKRDVAFSNTLMV